MAIDNSDVVDFIGIDKKSGNLSLTISDHLDWNDVEGHLEVLQSKINAYIAFVESGEIFKTYENAEGKDIIFRVAGKYILPKEAIRFYEMANDILFALKIELQFEVLSSTGI